MEFLKIIKIWLIEKIARAISLVLKPVKKMLQPNFATTIKAPLRAFSHEQLLVALKILNTLKKVLRWPLKVFL